MTAEAIVLSHDVEQERLHIVVERLGAQEEFGQQAEVLAVYWILTTVNLEEGVFAVAIYLVARRVLRRALEL
jgi:hypothetical protein